MKREIKFRAWDNVLKQHLPNIQNHIGNDEWAFGNILKNTERYTVEQFTGLKDRNGVEVYEGDIVSHKKYEDNSTVVYEQQACAFWLKKGRYYNELTAHYSDGDIYSSSTIEVIGNIHQNKDQ